MLKYFLYLKYFLLTTLFFAKIFLIDCRGGIGTFIERKVHNDKEPVFLDLGYWNIFKLKIILFSRYILKYQSLWQGWYDLVNNDILNRLKKQNISEDRLNLEVDIFDLNQGNSDQFFQEYLLKGKPIVIKRGSLEDENLFSNQYLLDHYGNTNVSVSDMATGQQSYCTLKDYLSADNSEQVGYIRASYNFTLENSNFVEQLNPQQFDAYMSGTRAKKSCYVSSELFLGASKETGTGFHAANGNNLFFMVVGKKNGHSSIPITLG